MPLVKRSKSGCVTCRIRKIKCDEAKPACQKCVSTGRACDGYSVLPFSRTELATAAGVVPVAGSRMTPPRRSSSEPLFRLVNDPAFSNIFEKRSFQFFRAKSVPGANALLGSYFWNRTVLQACHTTPSIKHAVLALSSWHQGWNGMAEQQSIDYADEQYRLALQHARTLIASADKGDLDKVVITCIVFICFEAVRGHFRVSQLHMDHGRAICKQHRHHFQQASRRNDLSEITQALARLELPMLGFSDTQAPYHYTVEDFHNTDPNLVPWAFKNVYEARTSLVDISRWLLVLEHYLDRANTSKNRSNLARLEAQKLQASVRLYEWRDKFESIATDADPSCDLVILNLRLWFRACAIMSEAGCCGLETRFDEFHHRFQELVAVGEEIIQRLAVLEEENQLSVSFEHGYLMPCFFAAQRCRDPVLRRRAIDILLAIPRQEGTWNNYGAAAVAQRWMEMEEEGGEWISEGGVMFVPEAQRVQYIDTRLSAALRKGYVWVHFSDEAREEREEVVEWGHLADGGQTGTQ